MFKKFKVWKVVTSSGFGINVWRQNCIESRRRALIQVLDTKMPIGISTRTDDRRLESRLMSSPVSVRVAVRTPFLNARHDGSPLEAKREWILRQLAWGSLNPLFLPLPIVFALRWASIPLPSPSAATDGSTLSPAVKTAEQALIQRKEPFCSNILK